MQVDICTTVRRQKLLEALFFELALARSVDDYKSVDDDRSS